MSYVGNPKIRKSVTKILVTLKFDLITLQTTLILPNFSFICVLVIPNLGRSIRATKQTAPGILPCAAPELISFHTKTHGRTYGGGRGGDRGWSGLWGWGFVGGNRRRRRGDKAVEGEAERTGEAEAAERRPGFRVAGDEARGRRARCCGGDQGAEGEATGAGRLLWARHWRWGGDFFFLVDTFIVRSLVNACRDPSLLLRGFWLCF